MCYLSSTNLDFEMIIEDLQDREIFSKEDFSFYKNRDIRKEINYLTSVLLVLIEEISVWLENKHTEIDKCFDHTLHALKNLLMKTKKKLVRKIIREIFGVFNSDKCVISKCTIILLKAVFKNVNWMSKLEEEIHSNRYSDCKVLLLPNVSRRLTVSFSVYQLWRASCFQNVYNFVEKSFVKELINNDLKQSS